MGKVKEQFYRHGDVYIARTTTSEDQIRSGKRVADPILAHGEVTGHTHALMDQTAFERYELDGETFLIVSDAGVSITHEEHGIGRIEPGTYKVTIDREYDYLADMSRQVQD